MLTKTARRGIPVVALVAASLALTACGPGDGTPSDAASSASASTPPGGGTAGAQGDPSVAPSAAPSGSAPGGAATSGTDGKSARGSGAPVAACATSRLKTTAEGFSSGAGHTGFQLVFQNTGTTPCTLSGYPGVSFVKVHNTQLGKAAERVPGATAKVTLIPNAHAYADVQTVNGEGGYAESECSSTTVPTLRVYPPNQKESTNIPWNKEECVGSTVQNLRVGPVYAKR